LENKNGNKNDVRVVKLLQQARELKTLLDQFFRTAEANKNMPEEEFESAIFGIFKRIIMHGRRLSNSVLDYFRNRPGPLS
jgi:hypothetical protein